MAIKTSKFLFVHDTVDNRPVRIDEREPIVAKAIRKHLQGYNRRIRLTRPENSPSKHSLAPVGWRKRSSRESSNDSGNVSPAPSDSSNHSAGLLPYHCSPKIPALQSGNSDPFSSFSVQVTARVNQVLFFYRHDFLKIPYTTAIVASDTYKFVLQFRAIEAANDQLDTMNVLKDEFCASGFLLAHMTMLASGSQDRQMALDVTKLKTQLYARLQARIEMQNKVDELMIEAVLQLFHAAVYAGDLLEAKVHGRCLLRLLKERRTERTNIVLLFRIAFVDIGLAATFRKAPVVNDGWISDELTKCFMHLQADGLVIPNIGQFRENLEPSIPIELRQAFVEVRRVLWIWWTQPVARLKYTQKHLSVDDHPQASLYRWLYAQLYVQSYTLVGFLAGAGREICEQNNAEECLKCCTGKVLATGLLALISASSGKILDVSQPIRPGTHLMLSHLMSTVDEALAVLERIRVLDKNFDVKRMLDLQKSLLWACFIGSLISHLHSKSQTKSGGSGQQLESVWHQFICPLGLSDSDEVEDVLGGFVYHTELREAEECRVILDRYFLSYQTSFS